MSLHDPERWIGEGDPLLDRLADDEQNDDPVVGIEDLKDPSIRALRAIEADKLEEDALKSVILPSEGIVEFVRPGTVYGDKVRPALGPGGQQFIVPEL